MVLILHRQESMKVMGEFMKKKTWALVSCLCLAVIGVAACGDGSSLAALLAPDFFPLNVGDQRTLLRTREDGAQATFIQTVEAKTTVDGEEVLPFTTRNASGDVVRVDYYGADNSDGVLLIGFDDMENNLSSRYDPPVFFPRLMPGETHSDTVAVTGGGGFASVTSLDYSIVFDGFETCTVPAGTFSNCTKFRTTVINKNASGDVVEQGTFTQFLVSGIGGVRLMHEGLSTGSADSQLVSATVDGRSVP
jgi:hypothetical protein